MTTMDDLTAELRDYLYRMLAGTPYRERGRWVMSAEWLRECLRLDKWQPPPSATPLTLLGIPIEVRDDAGAPWLEAAPGAPS